MSIVVVREPSGRVQVRAGGPRGPQGVAGPQGPPGEDGDAQGPPGPQGPPGAAGPQGPAGADGADGDDGAQGPQGPAGVQGPAGAQGPQGVAGPAGADGDDGADGADGEDGAPGAQGPPGAAGAQGPQGVQGVPGADGDDGADGAEGPEGPAGPQPPLSAADPLALAAAADPGVAVEAARDDHVHPWTGLATDAEAATLADAAQAAAEAAAALDVDAEETARIAADADHVAAGDPHGGYVLESAHTLAAHEALLLASDADLTTHAGAVDPHGGYVLESWIAVALATASQTKNNDGVLAVHTPASGSNLSFPIGTAGTWLFDIEVICRGAITTDIALQVRGPAGVSGRWTGHGPAVAATGIEGDAKLSAAAIGANTVTFGTAGAGAANETSVRIKGYVIAGGTPGNVEVWWAQATPLATDTDVRIGSTVVARRIG